MSLIGEIQKAIEEHGSSSILRDRLAFWQDKLDELKDTNARLEKEKTQAEAEIAKLRQELSVYHSQNELRSQVRVDKNLLLPIAGEIKGRGKGPWCTHCFETENLLVTLHHKVAGFVNDVSWYKWECPKCKNVLSAPQPEELH